MWRRRYPPDSSIVHHILDWLGQLQQLNVVLPHSSLLLVSIHHMCNALAQVDFWNELLRKTPSLKKLDSIGREMEHCIRRADESFLNVLKISPSSITTLRQYAQFLMDVSAAGSSVLSFAYRRLQRIMIE